MAGNDEWRLQYSLTCHFPFHLSPFTSTSPTSPSRVFQSAVRRPSPSEPQDQLPHSSYCNPFLTLIPCFCHLSFFFILLLPCRWFFRLGKTKNSSLLLASHVVIAVYVYGVLAWLEAKFVNVYGDFFFRLHRRLY